MSKPIQNWNNLFTYDTLVHAIAGAAGGFTAMTIFYPLDTVKARLQLDDKLSENTISVILKIIKNEGIVGLYRGLEPVLISLFASNFVYFYSFHGLRAVFNGKERHSALNDLFLGTIAGSINVFLTSPFWVVNTRMKIQDAKLEEKKSNKFPKYRNIFHGIIEISNNEGTGALWAGSIPSLLLVSNPALQFMFYETFKKRFKQLYGDKLSGKMILLLGATSKCLSTILTYPLQVIQSKLRYGNDDIKNKTMIEILLLIVKKNGLSGLYKGMEAKLYHTVLATALMFFCYEKITSFVFQILRNSK